MGFYIWRYNTLDANYKTAKRKGDKIMTRKEIEFQCQLAYDAKLLELIGKNVGDKVKCSFFVHSGDRKHSYTSSIDGEGTIILDEKGYGILSDKEYQDSKEVRDYPMSLSNFRTHWEYETKKLRSSIKYIRL